METSKTQRIVDREKICRKIYEKIVDGVGDADVYVAVDGN